MTAPAILSPEPLPLLIPEEGQSRNLGGSGTVRVLESVRRRPVFSRIRLALRLPSALIIARDDLPSVASGLSLNCSPVQRVRFDRSISQTPRAGGVPESETAWRGTAPPQSVSYTGLPNILLRRAAQ